MATSRTSLKRFQNGWRILIIFIAAFWIVSLVWSATTTPIYRAFATFLVYPNDTITSSRDVVSSLDTLDKRTISTTYADILDSNRVYLDTVERLQLDAATMENVTIFSEVQPDTNILVLSVEGPDPKVITLLANNIGQNGISFIQSIYQVYSISFLDLAMEPETPIRPRPLVDGLIAAAIGLGVGLIFLVLREMLRVPLETLRERSLTDKQSLAFTRKYQQRMLAQQMIRKKEGSIGFGLIHMQGLEDVFDGLPERVSSDIMQEIVQRLHSMLRGNDMVARWDHLVFSIMLPDTPETPAVKTFERLVQALDDPIQFESGVEIDLNPLSGLTMRVPEDTVEQLATRAESALVRAKDGEAKIILAK